MSEQKLHAKLAEVLAEVDRIPKNGTAPAAMGGFKFVQVGDAADVIRKALGTRKVSMLPTAVEVVGESEHATSSGKTMTTLQIRTTWTLTDGETGETAVIQSIGTGADTGDKASPKAQTAAMKYALLMGFLMSTGDDAEQSDTSDRQARGAVQRTEAQTNDGSLIGTVTKGKPPVDLELRQTPDGPIAGFKLAQGRSGIQVLAEGNLANALYPFLAGLIDKRVAVWGHIQMVAWEKDGKDMPPYRRLILSRIRTDDWELPGNTPAAQPAPDEPEEAPSEPFWPTPEEEAAILAREKAEAAA